jgi:hypothetical protein
LFKNKVKWAKVGLIGFALMMQLKPGDIGAGIGTFVSSQIMMVWE